MCRCRLFPKVDCLLKVEYCVKTQSQAKAWLISKKATISSEIYRRCKSKWKTDHRMVQYCVESQSKAKRNLNLVSKTKRRTGGRWYENGTLHKSSVAIWNNATYGNKLATSADWALAMPKIEAQVKKSGSMDTLRPFAVELVKCVNEAAARKGYDSMSTSELAASCMALMIRW